MGKNKLIADQQLKIQQYEAKIFANGNIKKELHGLFYAIGQPLNDNRLKFSKEQLMWAQKVYNLIEIIK